MRFAIVGTRGIPARYGGFETLAAELSSRLALKGHEVSVYSRRNRVLAEKVPDGVVQRFVPYVPGKYLETVTHTAFSILDSLRRDYDAVLMVNAANAIFAGIPRLKGTPVALNVDGIERNRAKWGLAGRAWYRIGERLATVFPNVVITDAYVIRAYYRSRYGRPTVMIPYGAALLDRDPAPDLSRFGLRAGGYVLYVSRLEPENNADLVIRAYRDVPGDYPLAIVGDAPYAGTYKQEVRRLASRDPRVMLLGGVYGDGYRDLQRGALAYVQATMIGGTHPALIEAMGAGNVVFALGSPENREVVGDAALVFDTELDLASGLSDLLANPTAPAARDLRQRARERARTRYSWDVVATAYERVLIEMARRPRTP
jgi:glycosyltransferase involved in cell wall biosynthesis